SASVLASGDIRQVNVSGGSGCNWTAGSSSSWITILSGASGNGAGTVRFNVAANTSTQARTGSLTIAGVTYTVAQAGGGCTYTLTGAGSTLPGDPGSYTLMITTQGGCQWNAVASPSWITLTGATSGSGSGSIAFSLAANATASPRMGAIVAGGQWFPILQ